MLFCPSVVSSPKGPFMEEVMLLRRLVVVSVLDPRRDIAYAPSVASWNARVSTCPPALCPTCHDPSNRGIVFEGKFPSRKTTCFRKEDLLREGKHPCRRKPCFRALPGSICPQFIHRTENPILSRGYVPGAVCRPFTEV